MADVDDAHNLSGQLERAYENVRDADIDEADKQAIENFADHRRFNGGLATSTVVTDLATLRRSAARAPRPLVEFDGLENVNTILKTNQSEFEVSERSNDNYRRVLRVFFHWMNGGDEDGEYSWWEDITIPSREVKPIDPAEVLDLAEVRLLREVADHPRDKAFVEFLADTGMRVTAACQIKRGGIDLDEMNPTFTPNRDGQGQKGIDALPLPIIQSEQYLRVWLNEYHPDDHPDSPVFCVRDYGHRERSETALSTSRARKLVKELADEAGIGRDRIHPHAFRHVATTRMRRDMDMTWDDIAHRTGWSDHTISRMKGLYGHLTHEDKNRRVFRYAGRVEDKAADEQPVFVDCVNCGREIIPEARYCPGCGADQESKFLQRDAMEAVRSLSDDEAAQLIELVESSRSR